MGYFSLPHNHVWIVNYYTGEVKTTYKRRSDNKVVPRSTPLRVQKSLDFKSKDQAEAKAAELREAGYEVAYVTEGFV